MKSIFVIIFTLFSFFGYAQESENPRKGFVFGASVGISNLNMSFPQKNQQFTNMALNWKIGYMLNPKLALLINGTVGIYENSLLGRTRKRDFGGVFPSVQYWVSPKFWVLGGVGLGTDAPVFYDLQNAEEESKYYTGFGMVSSAGYELFQRKNFTIDLQARLNYSRVSLPNDKINGLGISVLVGFNFY